MNVSPLRRTMIPPRRLILILLCVVFAASLTVAQNPDAGPPPIYGPKKKEVQGPRAIGVLETSAKGMRLVPITIKVDGQFYDATVYMAQPVPMALDSGVVYEVFKSGEPVGDFTVHEAEQNQPTGSWRGLGSFVSKAEEDKRQQQRAKEVAAEAARKAAEEKEEMGSRPVLKRKSSSSSTSGSSSSGGSTSSSTSSSPSSSDDDSDRPVLKRQTPESSAGTTTASTQTPAQTSTPGTPTSSPDGASSGAATTSSSAPASNDSEIPVLRRTPVPEGAAGPYKPDSAETKPTKRNAGAPNQATKKAVAAPSGLTNVQVAISDAAPISPHPYRWEWKDPEEQQKLELQAEKLALVELQKFAARTSGVKPGSLTDVSFQAFDLNYTNAPVVIFSARSLPAPATVAKASAKTHAKASGTSTAAPAGLEFYVTVVGREDIYGEMQKEFAVATDNHHLDAYPKMKLIDAVDVDGNGAADLLFHSTSDVSSSFVIYRDKGWSLEEVISVPEPKG